MKQTMSPFAVAEVRLSYTPNFKASERPKISKSEDSYNILKSCWDEGKLQFLEEFKVLLLNRNNRVIGIYDVSLGGISGTIADPKVIFAVALKAGASSIILAHNHPSGNLNPSKTDIALTSKFRLGGEILDIIVLDHLIITSEGYYSFTDDGMM